MPSEQLHYEELLAVGHCVQSRDLSSEELTRSMIRRIDAVDSALHSYAARMDEQALEDARRADSEIAAGRLRGPLHGVPIAVKDLIWTAGVPTAHGMSIHRDHRPGEDATVVRRLREAGAVILGKLEQTEGATIEHHPSVIAPSNPWHPDLWPGVSSSGSGVATAAGLCFGSLGSDTAGSIRFPSAANGVTGLKPTWGRVSRHGVFELAASLDHIGPMARSAADVAAILKAIAGADVLDPTASTVPVPDYLANIQGGIAGVRIGIDRGWALDSVDEPTRKMLETVLEVVEALGGTIHQLVLPDSTPVLQDCMPLCAIEAAVAHEESFPSRRTDYGAGLANMLDLGRALSAMAYQKILLRRADYAGRIRAVFGQVDLILAPVTAAAGMTIPQMAKLRDRPDELIDVARYTCPFDSTGSPALTLPGGMTAGGAPIGFQLVAGHFEEELLLRVGHAFQQSTSWHRAHPDL